MWTLAISMVNVYMMLRRDCELKRIVMPYSHREFNEKIGCVQLDPANERPRWKNMKQHPELLSDNKRKCT